MTGEQHILVLPDRAAAEEVAEELVESFGLPEEPQVLREALAGEDDAEDAQWLVVLEGVPARSPDNTASGQGSSATRPASAPPLDALDALAVLDALAEKHEGWRERD